MLFYLPHLTSYPPPKAIFSFVGWKKNIIDNFFTLRNFRKKHRVVHTSTWRRCSFFFYCTHFEIYYHEIKLLQFFFVYLFHVFLFIIKKLCREYQNMRILKFFLLHLTAILCHVRDKINFLLLQWKKGSVKLRENFRFPLLRAFLTVLWKTFLYSQPIEREAAQKLTVDDEKRWKKWRRKFLGGVYWQSVELVGNYFLAL